jgi:hypothetical protein
MNTRAGVWQLPLLVAALLAAGCGSSQMSRIDSDRALYESWPLETQQAVLDGRVETGMTPEQVRMALGKPAEVVSRSAGSAEDEIWIYRKGGDDITPMGGMGGSGLSMGGNIGGLSVGSNGGMGMGTSMGRGTGMGTSMGTGMGGTFPIMSAPTRTTPVEEREIVFENGVVVRADPAL